MKTQLAAVLRPSPSSVGRGGSAEEQKVRSFIIFCFYFKGYYSQVTTCTGLQGLCAHRILAKQSQAPHEITNAQLASENVWEYHR